MARSDVFIHAGNEHRDVSIGGRRNPSSGYARINTDNQSKSDCAVVVRAEVSGDRGRGDLRKTCDCGHCYTDDANHCPDCGQRRGGADIRKSHFTITLPDQQDENCQVEITTKHEKAAKILQIGAMFCVLNDANDIAQGKPKPKKFRYEKAAEILAEFEAEANQSIPNVVLPGGITLAHALACVKLVEGLVQHKTDRSN